MVLQMHIQVASRQQPPAPVALREGAKGVSIITLFLHSLIHCSFIPYLHVAGIVGSIF